MNSIAQRMHKMFGSAKHKHYVADFSKGKWEENKKKFVPEYKAIEGSIKVEEFESHLLGEISILAVPVNEQGMTQWGVIDIDVYPTDPVPIAKEIKRRGFPLVVIRSKSGGVQLHYYSKQFESAALLKEKLLGWASALGFARVEIFPKQTKLEPGDVGSGVNAPYMGGDAAKNHAVNAAGERILLLDFLDLIENPPVEVRYTPGNADVQSAIEYAAPFYQAGKHDLIRLAFIGTMLRAEIDEDTIIEFDNGLRDLCGDRHERRKTVQSVQRDLSNGKRVPGFKALTDSKDAYMKREEALELLRLMGADAPLSNEALEEMNSKHAVIIWGGKAQILTECIDPLTMRPSFYLSSVTDFRTIYRNRRMGKKDLGAWWLDNPERRGLSGVVFSPMKEVPGYYNLWRGFGCDAIPGDCSLFLGMVKRIICSGDESQFRYVIAWCADAVQNPTQRPGVVLVLRGDPGVGKGTFARAIGELFGDHYRYIQNARHLVGNFNAHLANGLLVFADEAFFAGDKNSESILKAMITEPELPIEFKGKDVIRVANHLRIIMASNHDWVVPAGMRDRRYVVLDVNPNRIQDQQYFAAVQSELKAGGREALLYHLQHFDLSGIDLRSLPQTAARMEQMLHTLNPIEAWWYGRLLDGAPLSSLGAWLLEVLKKAMLDDYMDAAGHAGTRHRGTATQFGMAMPKLVPGIRDGRPAVAGTRLAVYYLPPLTECRVAFAQKLGFAIEWPPESVQMAPPPGEM